MEACLLFILPFTLPPPFILLSVWTLVLQSQAQNSWIDCSWITACLASAVATLPLSRFSTQVLFFLAFKNMNWPSSILKWKGTSNKDCWLHLIIFTFFFTYQKSCLRWMWFKKEKKLWLVLLQYQWCPFNWTLFSWGICQERCCLCTRDRIKLSWWLLMIDDLIIVFSCLSFVWVF